MRRRFVTGRPSALDLGRSFLYPTQFVNNPVVDRPFFRGFMWTNPLKCLSLIGGAAIVAGRFPDQPRFLSALGRGFGRFEAQGA